MNIRCFVESQGDFQTCSGFSTHQIWKHKVTVNFRLWVTVSNFTRENTFTARNQYTLMKFCRYFSNCYIEFTKQFSTSLLLRLHNFKHNFHTISLKIPRLIGDFFCTKTNFVEIFSKKVQRFIVVLKLSKLISCRKNRKF